MSGKLEKIYNAFFPTLQSKRVKPWIKDNGDRVLRLNYDDLDSDSIVFDLGGYEGQWASDIYSIYNCNIYVFEPYEVFATNIMDRFKRNNKIHVFNFGLGSSNKMESLTVLDDSSSMFKVSNDKGKSVSIEIREVIDFFKLNDIKGIDLIKINIEGSEYDLLERLIVANFVKNIKNIQVQFHDFVHNSRSRMVAIQEELKKTHEITYQYEYVWENWKLKSH